MQKNSGFTLIEIMLVVIIISVLAAMVVPRLTGRGEQARVSAARADIEANLGSALDLYELDNGAYPTTLQGLRALVEAPSEADNWSGPYLQKQQLPKDPWGQEYQYVSPGKYNTGSYDLYSFGPDGAEGNDDIANWAAAE